MMESQSGISWRMVVGFANLLSDSRFMTIWHPVKAFSAVWGSLFDYGQVQCFHWCWQILISAHRYLAKTQRGWGVWRGRGARPLWGDNSRGHNRCGVSWGSFSRSRLSDLVLSRLWIAKKVWIKMLSASVFICIFRNVQEKYYKFNLMLLERRRRKILNIFEPFANFPSFFCFFYNISQFL